MADDLFCRDAGSSEDRGEGSLGSAEGYGRGGGVVASPEVEQSGRAAEMAVDRPTEETVAVEVARDPARGKGVASGSGRSAELGEGIEPEVGLEVEQEAEEEEDEGDASLAPFRRFQSRASKFGIRERRLVEEARRFYVKPPCSIREPAPTDRVCFPGPNEMGVYLKDFEMGLRFPINPLLVAVLKRLGLALFQLTPNSIANVTAFTVACERAGFAPSVSLFRYFFRVTKSHDHFYLGARQGRRLIEGLTTKVTGWVDRFVFAEQPIGELPATEWCVIKSTFNREPVLSADRDRERKVLVKKVEKGPLDYKELATDQSIADYCWPGNF